MEHKSSHWEVQRLQQCFQGMFDYLDLDYMVFHIFVFFFKNLIPGP